MKSALQELRLRIPPVFGPGSIPREVVNPTRQGVPSIPASLRMTSRFDFNKIDVGRQPRYKENSLAGLALNIIEC
ncbi:MAG TPA: hypothetical protein VMU71_01395 [Terracidiphilus sp.]|nr:hypothetical protein [Terracidiphilus sp.]